ncbi:MAG: hypothetical protein LBU61_03460 [Coriobacteriales bacterium]|jgi:hypothetical protein|nr:hypothetical protein [Coriobacteriales bacterium]
MNTGDKTAITFARFNYSLTKAYVVAIDNLQGCYKQIASDQKGQATIENALVWLVLAGVLLGFGMLQKKLGEGLLIEHALRSASHALGPNMAGTIGDVFMY